MSDLQLVVHTLCPYCRSESDCAHLLLLVNLTLRQSAGGALYEVFEDAWQYAKDKLNDGDEDSMFDRLLDVVSSNSDFESNYIIEGGPGQTYEYIQYYSKHASADAEIFEIKDDLYSAVDDQDLAYLPPYRQAEIIWKDALNGTGDFKSTPKNIFEIIVKNFNLSLLPISLQTVLLVKLVDTSSDAPEIVQKISVNLANEIYQHIVNSYPNKISSIHSYLNKYISFAREKVIWRRLGYGGVKQRTSDADMQGALLLSELLAKEE